MGIETGFEPRKVKIWDGYAGERVWKHSGAGTYYDYHADTQCGFPARSLEEITKELEEKWGVDLGSKDMFSKDEDTCPKQKKMIK